MSPTPRPQLWDWLVTVEVTDDRARFTWTIRASTPRQAQIRCWNGLVRKGIRGRIVRVEPDR